MTAEELAMLLDEANHHPWESVQAALSGAHGEPHPRIGWLTTHLTQTKRQYWSLLAEVAGTPLPAEEWGLTRLMVWEVEQVRQLTPQQLALPLTYGELEFTVESFLRLNARHTTWHAGQIASLAGRVRSA